MPTVIALLNSYAGTGGGRDGICAEQPAADRRRRPECRFRLHSFGDHVQGHEPVVHQRAVRGVRTSAGRQRPRQAHAKPRAQRDRRRRRQILAAARKVIIVPGYGMAVAQAQHKLRELTDTLTKRGVDVQFAIHPVAGRMPGHMNVLLAEADISYDRLHEMEEINSEFSEADVALVIGANDVVNPAARHDKTSPIYGMPILDVDKAHTVMVIKRSMNPGFAGIDNELYYMDRTLMLFGDAKAFVSEIVKELPVAVHA